jgi:hypothetical protein
MLPLAGCCAWGALLRRRLLLLWLPWRRLLLLWLPWRRLLLLWLPWRRLLLLWLPCRRLLLLLLPWRRLLLLLLPWRRVLPILQRLRQQHLLLIPLAVGLHTHKIHPLVLCLLLFRLWHGAGSPATAAAARG